MKFSLVNALVRLFTQDLDTIARVLQNISDRIEAMILSQAEEIGQLEAYAEDLIDAAEVKINAIYDKANIDADAAQAEVEGLVREVRDQIAAATSRFETAKALFGKVPGNANA